MPFPNYCFVFHFDLSVLDDSIKEGKDRFVSAECLYLFALTIYTPVLFCRVSFYGLCYSTHPTHPPTSPKPLRPHQTIDIDHMQSFLCQSLLHASSPPYNHTLYTHRHNCTLP